MTLRALLWAGAFTVAFCRVTVAQQGFNDDFADGDVFDDDPVRWAPFPELACGDLCCAGIFQAESGDLVLWDTSGSNTGLLTKERFEGDVFLRAQVAFRGHGRLGLVLHHNGCLNQYGCTLNSRGEAWVYSWTDGQFARFETKDVNDFPPERPPENDFVLQLDRKGDLLELRVWTPDQPMPDEPIISVEDARFDSGHLGLHYLREESNARAVFRFFRMSTEPLEEWEPIDETGFRRGDCNVDGTVNLADAVCALEWLFAGVVAPGCLAALNTNGDDKVDIADPVSLLNFLFGGGAAPVAPYADCSVGVLQADRDLGCETNCQ